MGTIRRKLLAFLSLSFLFSGTAQAQETADLRDPSVLGRMLENEERQRGFLLIDVRSAGEYASGHIPGAVNIPHTEIGDRIEEAFDGTGTRKAKDPPIVVYCRSGARSGYAQGVLRSMGYTNVINFGGVSRWEDDLVRGGGNE